METNQAVTQDVGGLFLEDHKCLICPRCLTLLPSNSTEQYCKRCRDLTALK